MRYSKRSAVLPAIWMIYKHLEERRGAFSKRRASSEGTATVNSKILPLFKTRLCARGPV